MKRICFAAPTAATNSGRMHTTIPIVTVSTVNCTYCARSLKEFDINSDDEGDEMWIFPLNDNQGGEGIMCETCWHNKTGR